MFLRHHAADETAARARPREEQCRGDIDRLEGRAATRARAAAFALSFDDLVVTSFNYGVGSATLPIYIYSAIKFGVTPEINAISTLVVAVVAIALFITWRLGAFRTERRSMAVEDAPAG